MKLLAYNRGDNTNNNFLRTELMTSFSPVSSPFRIPPTSEQPASQTHNQTSGLEFCGVSSSAEGPRGRTWRKRGRYMNGESINRGLNGAKAERKREQLAGEGDVTAPPPPQHPPWTGPLLWEGQTTGSAGRPPRGRESSNGLENTRQTETSSVSNFCLLVLDVLP